MALSSNILLSVLAHETSGDGLASVLRASGVDYSLTLQDGENSYVAWSHSASPTGVATDEYNLRSLADGRGTVSFSTVNLLLIRNRADAGTVNLKYVEEDGTVTVPSSASPWLTGPFQTQNIYTSGGVDVIFASLDADQMYFAAAGGSGFPVPVGTRSIAVQRIGSGTTPLTHDILIIGQGTIS